MTSPLERLRGRRPTPVIHSAEVAECGLACLAMIGQHHGHDIDLNGLRRHFTVSLGGASLRGLMAIGDQMGLASRPLRVELSALQHVALPAVLHWNLDHFVVLVSLKGDQAVIHDPAKGRRVYSLKSIGEHFTGVVIEFTPAADFTKLPAGSPVKLGSLWSKSRGFWWLALQILGLSLALQVAAFVAPLQMQIVVDQAISRGDAALLTALALGFGAVAVLQCILEALRAWVLHVAGNLLSFQFTGNIVRHLLRLPSTYFERRNVGDILARISSTTAIQDALTQGVVSAIIDGVMATVAALILFIYSPLLAAIVIGAVLLVLLINFAFYPVLRDRTEAQLNATGAERTHLLETLRAATIVKVMGRGQEREGRWRNLFASVINANVSVAECSVWQDFLQRLTLGMSTVLVIYLGARAVMTADGLSVGMLVAFLSFRQTFTDRAANLVRQTIAFRMLRLHLDRLSDIITAEPDPRPTGRIALEHAGIEFRNVSFRYGATDAPVLEAVSFRIEAGEFVAIHGPSGSGKSTLLKLLLGLAAPTSGEILIGGRLATPELWHAWRESIGYVSQDDRLLSGSIAENIAFFDPDMNLAGVVWAARAAFVDSDIAKMPMQYHSLIGDMGSVLSGGQKQRILLARALYRKPQVLILDEGTANLDAQTEEAVCDMVGGLAMTRIVVAHRPAFLARAGRLLKVGAGAVAEEVAPSSMVDPKSRKAS